MARGQATVEDMATSLKGVGSLASLTGNERPKRDSPLAASRPRGPTDLEAASAGSTVMPAVPSNREPPVTVSAIPRASTPERSSEATLADSESQFTDVVTVPMTARMRTRARDLAAELQRRRLDKSHRITVNVVLRVAIESFLERFDARDLGGVSSEAEMLERVARATKAPRKGLG
jgi:hypothetical protein